MMKNDEVCLFVEGIWFEGQVMQVDNDIILLNNLAGSDNMYYTTAIAIESIDALQFTTDFRFNESGILLNKEEIENNK